MQNADYSMHHELCMALVYHETISVRNKINLILYTAIRNMFWTRKTAYVLGFVTFLIGNSSTLNITHDCSGLHKVKSP
jgi:hypothetical protein